MSLSSFLPQFDDDFLRSAFKRDVRGHAVLYPMNLFSYILVSSVQIYQMVYGVPLSGCVNPQYIISNANVVHALVGIIYCLTIVPKPNQPSDSQTSLLSDFLAYVLYVCALAFFIMELIQQVYHQEIGYLYSGIIVTIWFFFFASFYSIWSDIREEASKTQ